MGTREKRLAEAVLTSTYNLYFEQKYEKYQIFLSENFQFLVVKFSIYLNRCVFVMQGVPQSQAAALPRHEEEEETDKTKQAQIKQT